MKQYKVGDKVRIVREIPLAYRNRRSLVDIMDGYLGKETVIAVRIESDDGGTYKVDGCPFRLDGSWFEVPCESAETDYKAEYEKLLDKHKKADEAILAACEFADAVAQRFDIGDGIALIRCLQGKETGAGAFERAEANWLRKLDDYMGGNRVREMVDMLAPMLEMADKLGAAARVLGIERRANP